jgi:hypothetical protein
MTLHDKGKLLLLSINPLIPLRILPAASLEALHRQRLFQRYPRIQAALAAGGERNKVNM